MIMILVSAILIGLSLGILGSGGAILTVPVLIYVVGQPEKLAIAGALVIVGVVSLVSSIPGIRQQRVDWSLVGLFGLPGMVGTYGGAWLASFLSGIAQMSLFSIVMLAAAWRMYHSSEVVQAKQSKPQKVVLQGVAVGILTGLVGVGGGFLIVPALVLLAGLAMSHAVATSLVIITFNCVVGFAKYYQILADTGLQLDGKVILTMTAMGIVGSLAGQHLAKYLPQQQLKRLFALFLVLMGIAILYRNLSVLMS